MFEASPEREGGAWFPFSSQSSGVARAYPGGQLTHTEGKNDDKNEKMAYDESLRKTQSRK